MFRGIRQALFGLGLLLGTVQASQADVVLHFTQVGPAMQNPYPGPGEPFPIDMVGEMLLVVTDEAFAAGLNLSQRNGGLPPYAYLDGVVALQVGLRNIADEISASLPDFLHDIPFMSTESSMIQITSAPGGMPTGFIFYNSPTDMTVRFGFNSSENVAGHAIGDRSCFVGCQFGGVLTVSVPEPASALTFGFGLLFLSALRTRHRARRGLGTEGA